MNTIELHNYQAHEKTIIKPAPTLTSLTGKSDHGKSSILRALKFVRENKPTGSTFIRKGAKETVVKVDKITHERTKSTNKYYVEGKKAPYKALRGAVPEEITNELNLGEVNIQGQHDKPFLLDISPGKVAQQLANLVDLDKPTSALAYIKSKKRYHTSKADVLSKSIEGVELQLSKLEHVASANKELAVLERKGVEIEKLHEKRSQLYIAHKNAVQAEYKLSRIPSTKALQPAKSLLKKYNELQEMKKEHRVLNNSYKAACSLKLLIQFNPTKLLTKAKRLKKLIEKRNKLATAMKNAVFYKADLVGCALREKELQKKKDKLLEGTCPLCGRQ